MNTPQSKPAQTLRTGDLFARISSATVTIALPNAGAMAHVVLSHADAWELAGFLAVNLPALPHEQVTR